MKERKRSSFSPIFVVIHSGRVRGVVTQGQAEVQKLDILETYVKIKEAASLWNVCGVERFYCKRPILCLASSKY
jgi:hypothetical protein